MEWINKNRKYYNFLPISLLEAPQRIHVQMVYGGGTKRKQTYIIINAPSQQQPIMQTHVKISQHTHTHIHTDNISCIH